MEVGNLGKPYSLLNLAYVGSAGRIRCSQRRIRHFFAPTQKVHPDGWPFALFDAWQFPTLAWGDPTLPSALRRFTSEFGMGSGGTTALRPPGKFCLSDRFCVLI